VAAGIELVLTDYALDEKELADVCGEIGRDVLIDGDALWEAIGVVVGNAGEALRL
jgi:hypothetical protein